MLERKGDHPHPPAFRIVVKTRGLLNLIVVSDWKERRGKKGDTRFVDMWWAAETDTENGEEKPETSAGERGKTQKEGDLGSGRGWNLRFTQHDSTKC